MKEQYILGTDSKNKQSGGTDGGKWDTKARAFPSWECKEPAPLISHRN